MTEPVRDALGRYRATGGRRTSRPLLELLADVDFVKRFWARVLMADGCWPWQGAGHADGYGQLGSGRKNILAHRISWELHNGPIPAGLGALHKCDIAGLFGQSERGGYGT
jgi:HNH endonuclease